MAAPFYVRQAGNGKGMELVAKAENGKEAVTILSAVGPLPVMRAMLQRTADELNNTLDKYESGHYAGSWEVK